MRLAVILSIAILAVVVLSVGGPANAGSREVYLLVVNMSPDGSGVASKACVEDVTRTFKNSADGGEGTRLWRVGESAMRKAMKIDKTTDFMSVKSKSLKDVKERVSKRIDSSWPDMVLMVECLPEKKRLRSLLIGSGEGVFRSEIRGEISSRRRKAFATYMASVGSTGWGP